MRVLGKGNKVRLLPLAPEAIELLVSFRQAWVTVTAG
jgi:site-specific recombinase XerD